MQLLAVLRYVKAEQLLIFFLFQIFSLSQSLQLSQVVLIRVRFTLLNIFDAMNQKLLSYEKEKSFCFMILSKILKQTDFQFFLSSVGR